MAGSFLNSQYREVRPARAEQLADGRKRLTRFVSFKQNSEFPAEMGGTVATTTDAATNWASPPTGWENLYLISAVTDTSLSPNGSGNNPVTILTFESAGTIAQTDETKNNGALLLRTIRTAHTAPATPSGYTLIQTVDDNPSGFDTFTYTFAKGDGQVSRVDETRNNGALLVATITHLTAPGAADPVATLSGYTRVSISNQESDGHEVWRAVFMQGSGEIGRDISYRQSSDQGDTGVTITTIRYIVQDEGTVLPASLSGSVLIGKDYVDQDGHRIWTTTWAKGTGTVSESTEIKNNEALYIYRKVALGTAPTAPTGNNGGTVTLISESERDEAGFVVYERAWAEGDGEISRSIDYLQSEDEGTGGVTRTTIRHLVSPSATVQPTSLSGSVLIGKDFTDVDGHRIWTTVWAKGTGLVAQYIAARQDGLREVTNVTLGTRTAPDGIVIRDDYRIVEGFKVYTVSSIQSASGGNPTAASVSFERYVPFTYPGRAKAFSETVSGSKYLDVFRSPPVTTDVKATVTVTYTATNTIGSVADYWNPSEWATIRANWTGLRDTPNNVVTALPGYRSVSATAVTATASAVGAGSDLSCLGGLVFGGTTASITCTGGPSDPGGTTKTLDVTIEPAFVSTAGTAYYRKTVVSASIPAQAALPV